MPHYGRRKYRCDVARLNVDGDELVLNLSGLEKVEGLHGDIRVAVSTVRVVRCTDEPWSELRGIRAPGTGMPGVIAVGTRRGREVKDFAAVHGQGPAVVVELEGAEYGRLVVTEDDAETAAAELRRQIGLV
jgi:ssDNA-binding replication factor A large subunit